MYFIVVYLYETWAWRFFSQAKRAGRLFRFMQGLVLLFDNKHNLVQMPYVLAKSLDVIKIGCKALGLGMKKKQAKAHKSL